MFDLGLSLFQQVVERFLRLYNENKFNVALTILRWHLGIVQTYKKSLKGLEYDFNIIIEF